MEVRFVESCLVTTETPSPELSGSFQKDMRLSFVESKQELTEPVGGVPVNAVSSTTFVLNDTVVPETDASIRVGSFATTA